MPLNVLIIASMISFLSIFSFKMAVKDVLFRLKNGQRKKPERRVLIFGAGDAGVMTYDALKKDNEIKYLVVGFLDDDPHKKGQLVRGARVLGGLQDLDRVIADQDPDEMILAMLEVTPERKKEVMELALEKRLRVYTIPPVNQWVSGQLESASIRKINIEDLLGRRSIKLRNEKVTEELGDKSVLVTGAAGSIGSELVRQIVRTAPRHLMLLDQSESALYDLQQELKRKGQDGQVSVVIGDVRNRTQMMRFFERNRPEYVFHAAAYKHVPLMEAFPSEAFMVNVSGTRHIADAARRYGTRKFVMVSTDKAVNPTNVMGATKRIAEMYIQSLHANQSSQIQTKFITTRFGNVLGSNGSVIPLFTRQIEEGGPVTVTHRDMTRYFMTIPEACELVLEAGVMGQGGEVYVFDMGKPVKIMDLAKKMVHLSGKRLDVDIQIVEVGLREGEKMYEELLHDEESTKETHHEKIFIAHVLPGNYQEIATRIDLCRVYAEETDDMGLVKEMKRLVPEFISNHSKFMELDLRKN